MRNGRTFNGNGRSKQFEQDATEVSLEEIRNELSVANRLLILSLIRSGIQQADIAAGALQKSKSVLSEMFPKGLLKRVAKLSKEPIAAD